MSINPLLERYFRELGLSTFAQNYATFAQQFTPDEGSWETYLQALCEVELDQRRTRRIERTITAARLPARKELSQFDWSRVPQSLHTRVREDAIASASDDGTVQVWKFWQAKPETIYSEHRGRVNAVVSVPILSYYGLLASAGDDQTVQVWEMSGHRLLTYSQHHAPVKALAASPVDRRIVSGDENGLVHLWTITGLSR